MKKNIILAVTLAVICLNLGFAQEKANVNAAVIRSFEKKFAGASNVKWESQPKQISFAQFRFENETWLAYYTVEGNLISSGRLLKSINSLPIKVKESLQTLQDDSQAKYGNLVYSLVYEMTTDHSTEYFIPMESQQASLLVSFTEQGASSIRRKVKHDATMVVDKAVIAKRN